jgi:stage II sporulation protein AA (anti-sigma F factor antagonist)
MPRGGKMKLEKVGNQLIIRLEGELDHHYASRIRQAADAAVAAGDIRRIIFDFTRVGFMDSSGIGVIMGRYKLMQSVGGSVAAFGFSPMLDKLISMSGITKLISVYSTEQEALRGVS